MVGVKDLKGGEVRVKQDDECYAGDSSPLKNFKRWYDNQILEKTAVWRWETF